MPTPDLTPDGANSNASNRSNNGDPGGKDKAPIDQWLAGDLSTTEIIDNILGFFGIGMNSRKRRGEEDEDG